MDLSKLKEPFPAQDIEWRVSRAGMANGKIFCRVLAYCTARAIQNRLDEVCGPENWKLEEPKILDIGGKPVFACGISIHCRSVDWITKWDVCEPTNIEPAKGGWSGAMKRAGAQWGIGRHLYYLDEEFADVSESKTKGWNYAKLPEKSGGSTYYWKPPQLPAWALPKEPESEVSKETLAELAIAWRVKFEPSGVDAREGFTRFVHSVVGEFPIADHACWTKEAIEKCQKQIDSTTDPAGPDADVPFGEGEK